MRHGLSAIGHDAESRSMGMRDKSSVPEDFALEKSIFNNIFEKDIRRVFMYKKAERLAKAIHLIAPAFAGSPSLYARIDTIAVGLVDAAILPPSTARVALSRELLTLSSILAIARTTNLLSAMNAELITREVHFLLQEVASYEEPRISLEENLTLSGVESRLKEMTRSVAKTNVAEKPVITKRAVAISGSARGGSAAGDKGHPIKDREEAILTILKNKGVASIKDISLVIRGVSEKTVQRELISLIDKGLVIKKGERRWSTYSLS